MCYCRGCYLKELRGNIVLPGGFMGMKMMDYTLSRLTSLKWQFDGWECLSITLQFHDLISYWLTNSQCDVHITGIHHISNISKLHEQLMYHFQQAPYCLMTCYLCHSEKHAMCIYSQAIWRVGLCLWFKYFLSYTWFLMTYNWLCNIPKINDKSYWMVIFLDALFSFISMSTLQ